MDGGQQDAAERKYTHKLYVHFLKEQEDGGRKSRVVCYKSCVWV